MLVKSTVAGRTRRQTMADELLFAFQAQPARRSATGHDQRLRFEPFIVCLDPDMFVLRVEIGDFGIRKARAEFFRLLVHV